MSKTIAVFGAGSALGLSIARRFGREGFGVALVARDRARLDGLAATLAAEGVQAAAFAADLTDAAATAAAVDAIEARFGRIDVLEYGPGGLNLGFAPGPVTEIGPEELRTPLELFLLAPVGLVRRVLPGMIERGDGALLFTQGASAKYPIPFMGDIGTAMAAMRHYILTLSAGLEGTGVHAGTLTIGAGIKGSDVHRLLESDSYDGPRPEGLDLVDPAVLADVYWDMYVKRDRVEEVAGNFGG
ncbi:SDR family NAD(P)-dependent oxidoreductase [Spirillospora sp. NBC_01491]|uniref:SDR family NAD(P)-dependent oxidoreductase n=1 Tax=Spirillospora sp. NBC_01491 TaxID=2976007 RepID=UPI002E307C9A|nr:SDR family NAD(P)-dependent oxidoreductase [Spirillospora sp. NBC_01491]